MPVGLATQMNDGHLTENSEELPAVGTRLKKIVKNGF